MLSNDALDAFKSFIEKNIASARYKIGGTYYDVPIHKKERLTDGKVAIYFSVTPQLQSTAVVSEVQLLNTNRVVWANKIGNIEIKSTQEGILYRFVFDFKEVQNV